MKIVDPTGGIGEAPRQLAPRLGSLSGKTIALFANNKPNADVLLNSVGQALVDRAKVKLLPVEPKNAALAAPPETLEELSRSADAVLVGSAD